MSAGALPAEPDPQRRAEAVLAALPPHGLFHGKTWRVSPDPFPLDAAFVARLEKLGHQLEVFLRGCAALYRASADGRQPAWVAELLDRGKPSELVAHQRAKPIAGEIPHVIRPDIILTGTGFVIAELDSVPGGIGLTGWLGETYSQLGCPVVGGARGMLDGFAGVLPGGAIVVSQEASDYRPEMEWLAGRLNALHAPASWEVTGPEARAAWPGRVYRFFELFDRANVPCAPQLEALALDGRVRVTPPFKPALEEKLWFALFWLKPLEAFWVRALGGRVFAALREVIPYTWLADPSPLPPHAVLPRLDVHTWDEVAAFSQKHRELILKVSGFAPTAWGSRGVIVGSDVPAKRWSEELARALAEWDTSPHILQRFHYPKRIEHSCLDAATGRLATMHGRARLCPYFFVRDGKSPFLGGVLATICPDDKKLLHGMPEAILTPAGPA